jgi:hypothetical protein
VSWRTRRQPARTHLGERLHLTPVSRTALAGQEPERTKARTAKGQVGGGWSWMQRTAQTSCGRGGQNELGYVTGAAYLCDMVVVSAGPLLLSPSSHFFPRKGPSALPTWTERRRRLLDISVSTLCPHIISVSAETRSLDLQSSIRVRPVRFLAVYDRSCPFSRCTRCAELPSA